MKTKSLARKKTIASRYSPLTVVLGIILLLYTLSLFGLLAWGFMSTFKSMNEFEHSYGLTFPKNPTLDYYKFFITNYHIDIYHKTQTVYLETLFLNSFLYAIGCAILQTIVPCITAYVCARYDFKFLKLYYLIVIVTMIIPIVGSQASEIALAKSFGLIDHIWGLWVMKANFIGFYFLIFFSTFKNLPTAFAEAAKIDGASNLKIMTRVMLPLVRNEIVTIFLIYFIQFWNDYQTPLLYMPNKPTIFYAIYSVMAFPSFDQTFGNVIGEMTLAFIGLIPTTLVFVIFHKKLLGSITVGGVK
ncbi:MAG: carbohydrate ABC transporter permease [Bacilli bacterium]|nr:carbohydrate ABC transporter permease [Bacilli bacterium]